MYLFNDLLYKYAKVAPTIGMYCDTIIVDRRKLGNSKNMRYPFQVLDRFEDVVGVYRSIKAAKKACLERVDNRLA